MFFLLPFYAFIHALLSLLFLFSFRNDSKLGQFMQRAPAITWKCIHKDKIFFVLCWLVEGLNICIASSSSHVERDKFSFLLTFVSRFKGICLLEQISICFVPKKQSWLPLLMNKKKIVILDHPDQFFYFHKQKLYWRLN